MGSIDHVVKRVSALAQIGWQCIKTSRKQDGNVEDNFTKQWTTSGGPGEVQVKQGIFQGDSISPLFFVRAVIPLTDILRTSRYAFEKSQSKSCAVHG